MQSTYDRDARSLRLTFDSTGERQAFIDSARRESGFLVTLPVALGLHASVVVALHVDGDSSTAACRVAQVFDKGFGRFSTAFMVDDWPAAISTPSDGGAAERPAADTAVSDDAVSEDAVPDDTVLDDTVLDDTVAEASGGDPVRADDAALDNPESSEPVQEPTATSAEEPEIDIDPNEGEMRGTSPIHVIKQMNPRQRSLLAIKATRTQRHILLRDNSPQVLQNLLANPQIDSEEVLQIARSSHVVAPILQRIASDARWGANQEILAVIARHPKTPSIFAARLMPNLRTSDLRMMAKMSSGMREMTRKAALREYMKRTGQRV